MTCDNCGADIPEGAQECDFCGLTLSEMSGGSSAAVPLEHRLGEGLEMEKTFQDSQREHQEALAHSQATENQRRSNHLFLRGLVILMALIGGFTVTYQVVFKAGWLETALNGVVLEVGAHRYSAAHTRSGQAKKMAPTAAEPYFLEGATYFLEYLAPGRDSNKPEQNLLMAETRFQRALAADREHGPSHFYLGAIRVCQDRPMEARDEFERALKFLKDDSQGRTTQEFLKASQEAVRRLESNEKIEFYSGARQANEKKPTVWEGKVCAPFGRYPSQ